MCDILRFCLEIWNYYCIFVSGIRSGIFINPISLIIGGFVENQNTEELFKKYFNNLRPPINIDYKISLFS